MKHTPPMTTEIAFILDRSGSMESIRDAALAGFNNFLRDQQAAPGANRLTLVLFDDWIETRFVSLPVPEVVALNRETYVPRGSTALLDAIAETVDTMGQRFAAMPEEQRPQQVIVAILTDGEENASQRFTWRDVSSRISHQTDKYGWEFLFLGAGSDAIATASRLSIPQGNSAQYLADAAGQEAASATLARKINLRRSVKSGMASREEIGEADLPISALLREEDERRRKM